MLMLLSIVRMKVDVETLRTAQTFLWGEKSNPEQNPDREQHASRKQKHRPERPFSTSGDAHDPTQPEPPDKQEKNRPKRPKPKSDKRNPKHSAKGGTGLITDQQTSPPGDPAIHQHRESIARRPIQTIHWTAKASPFMLFA
ncbi:hypothetical protein [Ochrobactrum soli]|uniref:hypothetical protein n=1 Tax=Ochrobactrum soli TaxID=2448455 RepID=UPI0011B1E5AF|nr:hypothetical protein [[Ochrobactrum] soli]